MTSPTPALDANQTQALANIAEHGFQITHVAASHDGAPPYAYTTGLWEHLKSPELIVFGLLYPVANSVLIDAYRQIKDGQAVERGTKWTKLLQNQTCITLPVHATHMKSYLAQSVWYKAYKTGDETLDAFQIFWPGAVSLMYPWDEGCPEAVLAAQPVLYLPSL